MRVMAIAPGQYGQIDHKGDMQCRIVQEGEEFELNKAEDFSFVWMKALDEEAEQAERNRRDFESRRNAKKAIADSVLTKAMKDEIAELRSEIAELRKSREEPAHKPVLTPRK